MLVILNERFAGVARQLSHPVRLLYPAAVGVESVRSSIFIGRSPWSLCAAGASLLGFLFGVTAAFFAFRDAVWILSGACAILALAGLWMTLVALSLSIEIGREKLMLQSLFRRTRIAWSDVATITIATNFLGGYMLALIPGSGRGNVIGVVCFLSGRPSFATKAVLSAALTANPSIELHGAHPHFGTPPYSPAQVRELFDSDVSVRERV